MRHRIKVYDRERELARLPLSTEQRRQVRNLIDKERTAIEVMHELRCDCGGAEQARLALIRRELSA